MQFPTIMRGESGTRLFQGFLLGAVATTALGFSYGGWVLGGTASTQAAERAQMAVVTALAPVCADRFKMHADSASNLVALKKASSWEQSTLIEKGGWATMPGATAPSNGVARACADLLASAKS